MKRRIQDLVDKYALGHIKKRNVAMPTSGYLVREYELDDLSEEQKRLLNTEEIVRYMGIVGCLIWIQGIRFDIIFAVLYLAWFTKAPRPSYVFGTVLCRVLSYIFV